MPRLENPAGTMRTSRRGKGWTPRTAWAAAKHRGKSFRTPLCKRKATSSSKQLATIHLQVLPEADVFMLIQMGRMYNSGFALSYMHCVCQCWSYVLQVRGYLVSRQKATAPIVCSKCFVTHITRIISSELTKRAKSFDLIQIIFMLVELEMSI